MTTTVLVRYKTTSSAHAAANEALVHAVFDELRAQTPGGLRYATYRLEDGLSFVHLATLEHADRNPLRALPAFAAFQAELGSRCAEPPVVATLSPVDSYGQVETGWAS